MSMSASKVLFVFTGGTISMKADPVLGAVPALSGAEILSYVRGLEQIAPYEVLDFCRLPGPHMTPERMLELSDAVNEQLLRPEIAGVVVTHGTDTLEETAFLLDLRHESAKPVVFTGAMRNSSEQGYDGPANLKASARVAVDAGARGQGVMVVLHDTVHAAAEATKTDTQALDTFQSPGWGPLGVVDTDRVVWNRRVNARQRIVTCCVEPRVDLFLMAAGMDGRFIEQSVAAGARGIVVAGTGRGNVPPAALPAVQAAIEGGIPVVVASRCGKGRVLGSYGYEGSGGDLRRRGVIFAGRLPPQKARIKLMLALGETSDVSRIRELMEAGEYAG